MDQAEAFVLKDMEQLRESLKRKAILYYSFLMPHQLLCAEETLGKGECWRASGR